jgi:hypothetical protein
MQLGSVAYSVSCAFPGRHCCGSDMDARVHGAHATVLAAHFCARQELTQWRGHASTVLHSTVVRSAGQQHSTTVHSSEAVQNAYRSAGQRSKSAAQPHHNAAGVRSSPGTGPNVAAQDSCSTLQHKRLC